MKAERSSRACICGMAVALALCAAPAANAGARCFGAAPTKIGTECGDRISGTSGPDVIMGLGGHDVIRGLRGDDRVCGVPVRT